jgi:hypothetical protein
LKKSRLYKKKDEAIFEKEQAILKKDQVLAEKDQALAQAEAQKIITAKNLINLGLSITNVAEAMQASEAEVRAWLGQSF